MMANFQNLHLADKTFYLNYKTLFKTNISGAHEILAESDLDNKVLGATEVNGITSDIVNLQQYYYNRVPNTLEALLIGLDNKIKALEYKGIYSSSTTYYGNNIVSYNSQLYYCKAGEGVAVRNVTPTNTSYWVYLGLRGDKGAAGLGVVLRYDWDSSVAYSAKDVVSYNNYLYVALQSSNNKVPNNNPTYWRLLMDYQISKITTDENNVDISDIYMEEV